jgi:allantoate deiminase
MVPVDAARDVIQRCRSLAERTEEPGCITRTFLSPPMRAVHDHLSSWMLAAGMRVRVDAAGNLRGVFPGTSPEAPCLYIGSHLDTVPRAGAFDGVLGVVLGIALVHLIAPRRFPYSIEVIGFSDEEGVRFGVPFIGSRAFVGTVDEGLLAQRDERGTSLREAIARFGLDPACLPQARFAGHPLGYLEFHIEQGPVLDARGLPIGLVRTIAGQSRAEVTFLGRAGHAGTTPMEMRRDALAGAAEWINAVETLARNTPELVASIGKISVLPGGSNVIPGRCDLSLDSRHADDTARHDAVERSHAAAQSIADRRGLSLEWRSVLDQAAVNTSAPLLSLLERAVSAAGTPPVLMTSGAGHDAMVLAPYMPVGMIFLRSPGGISHHPDEAVREDDVAMALAAGLEALDLLAGLDHG